jgi:hypothetical protein
MATALAIKASENPPNVNYLGCFMNVHDLEFRGEDGSIDVCAYSCLGFRYIALVDGPSAKCWCGDEFRLILGHKITDAECEQWLDKEQRRLGYNEKCALYQNLGLPKPEIQPEKKLVAQDETPTCELDAIERRKKLALKNFKKGDGVIVHQHIRHCGGTFFCKLVRELTTCPNGIWKGKWMSGVPIISSRGWERETCWPYYIPVIKQKLRERVPILESDLLNRPGFPPVNLHSLEMTFNSEMPFHSEKLTWVTVIRDPITRIFGRGIVDKFKAYYPAYYAKRKGRRTKNRLIWRSLLILTTG